jgi:hypothetical protein
VRGVDGFDTGERQGTTEVELLVSEKTNITHQSHAVHFQDNWISNLRS